MNTKMMKNNLAILQHIVKIAVVVAILFVLSACSTDFSKEGKPMPELTYSHVEPLGLQVADIDIVNMAQHNPVSGDVSSNFPTAPDEALSRYAQNRLQPVGDGGKLNFVIERASVLRRDIVSEGMFEKLMHVDGREEYTVQMVIRLEVLSSLGFRSAQSTLSIEKSLIQSAGLTLAEREREWLELLDSMMVDVDQAVTASLQNSLHLVDSVRPFAGPSQDEL